MVLPRYSDLIENEETKRIANLFKLLLIIEDAIEIAINELDIEINNGIEISNLSLLDSSNNIDSIKINIDSDCRYSTIKYFSDIEVYIECKKGVQHNINRIYEKLYRECLALSVNYLAPRIFDKSEYVLILLGDGKGVILQGFEKNVEFPKIIDTIFLSHTHPYSIYPAFSRADVLTGIDILSNRGIGICVYSINGYLCIYRSGVINEEDYINLMKLANSYNIIDIDVFKKYNFNYINIDYGI